MKNLLNVFIIAGILLTAVSCNAVDDNSLYLPVQKAGLDRMEALLEGELEEDNGYLRINDSYDNYLLVWPHGFSLRTEEDEIRIFDEKGKDVAHVGDNIKVGGG